MLNKRRYLPSLGSFATFEVAAKHLSFTLAANELNVTQAAISQQIRGLEKALGVNLFKRMHNALELTAEGKRLLTSVTAGLDNISGAVADIRQEETCEIITISGTTATVALWFTPYVERFKARHPDVSFVLLASDENDRLRNFDNVDVSVICGNERAEVGEMLFYLFPEIVEPVCSPGFLETNGPIATPRDLHKLQLLELHPMHWSSEAIGWLPLTWSDWFRAQSHDPPGQPFDMVSNNYQILVDEAVKGRGVLLGWHHLVKARIDEGALRPIFNAPLEIDRSYYLKVNALTSERQRIQEFVEMIRADIENSRLVRSDEPVVPAPRPSDVATR